MSSAHRDASGGRGSARAGDGRGVVSRVRVAAAAAATVFALAAPAAARAADESSSVADLGELSIEELSQLEVTSVSRRVEKLSETPSAIQVVTGEAIHRSGASSIPEALRLASNLNVARQNAVEWIISSRGFSSDVGNKLLVMMDGRTIYTPLFSGVIWDRHDYILEDIDRIEVISGPGGSVWGANAVNGVINIMSRNARDTQGFYVEGGGGNELQAFGAARYGGKAGDDTWYRVYGKYAQRDEMVFPGGSDGSVDLQMAQGGFRVDSEFSEIDTFTLQGDYYYLEEDLRPLDDQGETNGGNILGRWTRTFNAGSDMSLQVYYDRTDLRLPVPAFAIGTIVLAPAGTFKDELDTIDADFQHSFRLGARNRFVWGLGYRYTNDHLDSAPSLGFFPEHLEQDLYSGFIQDELMVIQDKVYLTFGTKVEHTDYTGWEFEPSARIRWSINDRHMLWAAVSRAVRTPSRIDRDISQGSPPFFVLLAGGKDFKSDKVAAFEAGWRGTIGSGVSASLSTFYNVYNDIRSTSFSPAVFPLFFENNVEGETYGMELSVSYQPFDWWQLRAGYNFLESGLRVSPGKFDFNNALNETADPKNQYSLHSTMELPHDFDFHAGFRWVDQLPTNNAGVLTYVPAYAELDLRLAWQPVESLELSLVGQNLLHEDHPEFGVPGPGREEIEPGVYGKISWTF